MTDTRGTWATDTSAELHITFVCTGNICRSPMAEKIVAAHLDRAGLGDLVRVSSAGTTGWHVGKDAHPRTTALLRRLGYPTGHVAAQFGDEHRDADLVVALATGHERELAYLGVPQERLRLLRSFDPDADGADVPDPYYGTDEDYELVRDQIEAAVPGSARLGARTSATAGPRRLRTRRCRYRCPVRRIAFLLRPSWVILALLVAAFAYLCFTVLAPWQLGKNTTTSQRNQLIADSVRAEPVSVEHLLPSGLAGASAHDEWRRVAATGHYLPDSTVLVRLRVVENGPAYEVLTAFRLDDGRNVLVDRGYVTPLDGGKPPAAPALAAPSGQHTVEARIRRSEGVMPGKAAITQDGYRQVYSVDSGQVGTVLGLPLTGGYLQSETGQAGSFRPVPLPQLDAGPYLSYGLQWLAFGIMAPLGLAYFVRAELRERRKESIPKSPAASAAAEQPARSSEPATASPQPTAASAEPAAASPQPTLTPTEARLADRYGKRR